MGNKTLFINQLEKKVNFLLGYAFLSTSAFVLVFLMSFKKTDKTKFEEIDVKKINIVEDDGMVKMIISNAKKFPNAEMVNGKRTGRQKDSPKMPGILFFNDEGTECGGLTYAGKTKDGVTNHVVALNFDQYNQDQMISLQSSEYYKGDKKYISRGITINDRPTDVNIFDQIAEYEEILKIKDKAVQEAKFKEWEEKGYFGAQRIFLGKSRGDQNDGLFLFDQKGKPKIAIYVDAKGEAKIEFFNEKGEVINSMQAVKK